LKKINKVSQIVGFTLLEIMIAISILAIVVSLVYGTLFSSARISKALEEQLKIQDNARVALDRLCSELRLAYAKSNASVLMPLPDSKLIPPKNSSLYLASGISERRNSKGNEISFIASDSGVYMPGRQNVTGLSQISYFLIKNNDTFTLMRDELPSGIPVTDAIKKRIAFPVVAGVEDFRLRFFNSASRTWFPEWTINSTIKGNGSFQRLPDLIEITISLATPTGRMRNYTTIVALSNS
jgi:prepilin-type N-terminal cleavage/methylation domain-containing protein